ncbi:MAG: LysM peptidoglycan-binding domain-containing protein [Planctomycetes bacterium]|nr:LysM peptidoglycan-binding domain-containing protein [Planctomycetota bacterium]
MSTVVQPNVQPGVELNKPGAQPHAGPEAQPSAVKPVSTPPAGSALKTREGLEESLFNDLYMYKWKAGDTYPALAERFYGSQKLSLRLKTANEGRTEATLKPGDMIFVPNLEAVTPAAQEPALAQGNNAGAPGAKAPASATATKKNGVGADGFYTVAKGDVLSTISQKVYGTSKKWQKIYDANRDVLKDPNALKVGMKLRIPE